jgi:hypothetical protein
MADIIKLFPDAQQTTTLAGVARVQFLGRLKRTDAKIGAPSDDLALRLANQLAHRIERNYERACEVPAPPIDLMSIRTSDDLLERIRAHAQLACERVFEEMRLRALEDIVELYGELYLLERVGRDA